MWWSTGSGRIDLQLTKAQVQNVCRPGPNDTDVLALSQHPKIARQLKKIDPKTLRDELKEYGAWDDAELSDHTQNLQRVLWIAAWDIFDGNC